MNTQAVRKATSKHSSCLLLVFGFGNGCLDVSINARAVHVVRRL
jgi:hypothetical protein